MTCLLQPASQNRTDAATMMSRVRYIRNAVLLQLVAAEDFNRKTTEYNDDGVVKNL